MARSATVEEAAQAPGTVERVAELLGGSRVLHRSVRSKLDAHDALAAGLPSAAVAHLVGR